MPRESKLKKLNRLFWIALVLGVLFWGVAIVARPKMDPSPEEVREMQTAMTNVELIASTTLGPATVRIVPLSGYSAEVYVSQADLETVPFPDREPFVRGLGKVWCSEVPSLMLLPSLKVRDTKNGDRLASYNCARYLWQGMTAEAKRCGGGVRGVLGALKGC